MAIYNFFASILKGCIGLCLWIKDQIGKNKNDSLNILRGVFLAYSKIQNNDPEGRLLLETLIIAYGKRRINKFLKQIIKEWSLKPGASYKPHNLLGQPHKPIWLDKSDPLEQPHKPMWLNKPMATYDLDKTHENK